MRSLETVVVIGSGRIAPGIARACAATGRATRIVGRNPDRVKIAAGWAGAQAGRVEASSFADADLVIESVVEDFAVKQGLLRRVEEWLAADALVATNTSSFSVGSLAAPLANAGRFAGLHFLHPAEQTGVVEVVPGPATSRSTIDALTALVRDMGRQPLVLRRDVPGFIWNRLQFAMLRECLHMVSEGVADVASIDAAVSDGLAPRWLAGGPLATADLGGLATFGRVAEQLFPELSASPEVSEALLHRAESGGAFYRWSDESTGAVESLRADTLATAKGFAKRRRAVMPQADT